MDLNNTPIHERVSASLQRQGLMQHLGTRLLAVAPGEVRTATVSAPHIGTWATKSR